MRRFTRRIKRTAVILGTALALTAFSPAIPSQVPVVSSDHEARALLQYFEILGGFCWTECIEGLCCKKIIVPME